MIAALEHVKARAGMYFFQQDVRELFMFLGGWDMAQETRWAYRSIRRIAQLKKTGSLVPGPEHISFEEALEVIVEMVKNEALD